MSKIKSALLGVAVGDALGLPVQFKSRRFMDANPVKDMSGWGTFNLPPGFWSDDTSMTLAIVSSILNRNCIDCEDIMKEFENWLFQGWYTPRGKAYDVGNTTFESIKTHSLTRIIMGKSDLDSNGNGSLMRMIPIVLYCYYKNISEHQSNKFAWNVSALTHAHPISCIACELYMLTGLKLLDGFTVKQSMIYAYDRLEEQYGSEHKWFSKFYRIPQLDELTRDEIESSGYVVDSLEAALWCLLNSSSFSETLLKAVNLGGDTDTIAAIAGGLAGMIYPVPQNWVNKLARKDYLLEVFSNFEKTLKS